MPDMRLVIATLMGLLVVGMVLCVPYRAIGTLLTLVWVGMYLVLTMVVYCVWYANGAVRTRTHGTPLPKGRSHLRLVTQDYSIYVYGAQAPYDHSKEG
jgi:hypothetical protein